MAPTTKTSRSATKKLLVKKVMSAEPEQPKPQPDLNEVKEESLAAALAPNHDAPEPAEPKPKKTRARKPKPTETKTPTPEASADAAATEDAASVTPEKATKAAKPKVTKKKYNTKPTRSTKCGLDISVSKVKNIIIRTCVNQESFAALSEIKGLYEREKKLSLTEIPEHIMRFLEDSWRGVLAEKREKFEKEKLSKMTAEAKLGYTIAKKNALREHAESQNRQFLTEEFDTFEFNRGWNTNFYDGLPTDDWHNKANAELYTDCVMLINKNNIRFNNDCRIYITAFVERVVRQMTFNGILNCVENGDKTLKVSHVLTAKHKKFEKEFPLFPMITNLKCFKEFNEEGVAADVGSESEHSVESVGEADQDEKVTESDKKIKFDHYVGELCRAVKMELAQADTEDMTQSRYFAVNTSMGFKKFGSEVIVELLNVFGNILKAEVSSRGIKTVNAAIIYAMLNLFHIAYGIEAELSNTAKFIQEKYTQYKSYQDLNKVERKSGKKKDGLSDDEEDDL